MIKLKRLDGAWVCPKCNEPVKSYRAFYEHHKIEHSHAVCKFCGNAFRRTNSCALHERKCEKNPDRMVVPVNQSKLPHSEPKLPHSRVPAESKLATVGCKFCGKMYKLERTVHTHEAWCLLNPNRKIFNHSAATKKIMSEKRIQYLKEHPESHVWKYNDKFISKPCEILKSKLRERYIFIEEYSDSQWKHNYSIDIVLCDKKIGIEVNGNQHYDRDGKLLPYYQERHNYLVSEGWHILEIPYSWCYHDDKIRLIYEAIQNAKDIDFSEHERIYSEYIKKKQRREQREHRDQNQQSRVAWNKIPESVWMKRRDDILNSGVDLMRMGWVRQIELKVGYSRRIVYATVEHFITDFKGKCYRRCSEK